MHVPAVKPGPERECTFTAANVAVGSALHLCHRQSTLQEMYTYDVQFIEGDTIISPEVVATQQLCLAWPCPAAAHEYMFSSCLRYYDPAASLRACECHALPHPRNEYQ